MDLSTELATVRGELARADGKANTLLGLAGTAATAAITLAALGIRDLPTLTQVTAGTAVVLLCCAVAVLLLAVRPALPRRGCGGGWPTYADTTPTAITRRSTTVTEYDQAAELVALSRLARAKYRRIRDAVHLLLGALAAAVILPVTLVFGGA